MIQAVGFRYLSIHFIEGTNSDLNHMMAETQAVVRVVPSGQIYRQLFDAQVGLTLDVFLPRLSLCIARPKLQWALG